MIVLIIVLCVILSFKFRHFARKGLKLVRNMIQLNQIPGPAAPSLIMGSCVLLYAPQDIIFQKLREWARIYYPIYSLRVLHGVVVNLQLPDDFELVLLNSKHTEKSLIYSLLHGWLGTGLLTSKGQKWLTRRKILTPAFHFNILQQFVNVFNEQTEKLVETFKNLSHRSFISIDSHITEYTLKTIAETAMGTQLKFNSTREMAYRQAITDIGKILTYRLFRSWFMVDFINLFSPLYLKEKQTIEYLHSFTREVIEQHEKNSQKIQFDFKRDHVYKSRKRLAMLDLLLSAKNEDHLIDNKGIREEVDTFMFEGHDTTATALGFALMLIACHRNVQDLIFEEMVTVLGDSHKRPTYNDLQEMKYLERALKESLRIYPSVHFISRQLGQSLVTATGYELPRNTIVQLHIYDLHHNPDIYPDPDKFDPDRFLPENCKNRHPFAYLPFSAGARNCIGQRYAMLELKATICGILANFILEPVDTPKTVVLIVDFMLRTKEPIKVKFVPRA